MMNPKPVSQTTDEEKAISRAEFERMHASLPEASESNDPAIFRPGVIGFLDGNYTAVSPDVATVWPRIEWWINSFLELLPVRHRPEYWRERIERGATLATWFVSREDWQTDGAGIINVERSDDGQIIVFASVMTFRPIDLTSLSKICEMIAVAAGVDAVHIWTPQPAPVVAGYHIENCWLGQLQVGPVKPIQ